MDPSGQCLCSGSQRAPRVLLLVLVHECSCLIRRRRMVEKVILDIADRSTDDTQVLSQHTSRILVGSLTEHCIISAIFKEYSSAHVVVIRHNVVQILWGACGYCIYEDASFHKLPMRVRIVHQRRYLPTLLYPIGNRKREIIDSCVSTSSDGIDDLLMHERVKRIRRYN
ncbi:hypothetical protein KCU95_g90, partial [Aureobasidium melanogenum]